MTSPAHIGRIIRLARKQRGLTQTELAEQIGSSQGAVGRIESGQQNLSLELINRIAEVLENPLIVPSTERGSLNFHIAGKTKLEGSIETRSSKNAAVALMCASLLNHGRTVLRGIAHIEEVARLIEVLTSIGVELAWSEDGLDLEVRRPATLDLAGMDVEAARKTRSILMFLGPLMHDRSDFYLPFAGGCALGARSIKPHLHALRHFGVEVTVDENKGSYHCLVEEQPAKTRQIVLDRKSVV